MLRLGCLGSISWNLWFVTWSQLEVNSKSTWNQFECFRLSFGTLLILIDWWQVGLKVVRTETNKTIHLRAYTQEKSMVVRLIFQRPFLFVDYRDGELNKREKRSMLLSPSESSNISISKRSSQHSKLIPSKLKRLAKTWDWIQFPLINSGGWNLDSSFRSCK